MAFKMLACDYDGTLATEGSVAAHTEQALREAKQAGLLLALVTGRMVDSVVRLFPGVSAFDLVVAENGAVLYFPPTKRTEVLGDPPPAALTDALTQHEIRFYVGDVIVGTRREFAEAVGEVMRGFAEERRVIFNKNDIMILPQGVDKATGLRAAIPHFGITTAEIVGVGDAENDVELFQASGLRVAVADALDDLKADADLVLRQPNGAGVVELVREHLLSSRTAEG